jgi:hypothetical protein
LQRRREAEALLVVLELELRPVVADLRGHGGVELVYGDNDDVREVERRRLPLIHIPVLFLLQQLRGATAVGGAAVSSAPASPCEFRGPDSGDLMTRRRVRGCDGAGRGLAAR